MAAPIYATINDYWTWSGDMTAEVNAALFVRASRVVDELLIGAAYTVDSAEKPTDANVAAALRDATCAQVQMFDDQGDTTGSGIGGLLGDLKSASIGSASYTLTDSAGQVTRTPSGMPIAVGAITELRVAGLLPVGGIFVNG